MKVLSKLYQLTKFQITKRHIFLLNSNNDKTKIPEFREIDNNGYSEPTQYYCVDSTYPKREGPMGNYMYCGINCVDSEYPNRAHGDNYRYSEPTQFVNYCS